MFDFYEAEEILHDVYYCDYFDDSNKLKLFCETLIEQLTKLAISNNLKINYESIKTAYKSDFSNLLSKKDAEEILQTLLTKSDESAVLDASSKANDERFKIHYYFKHALTNLPELYDILENSDFNARKSSINMFYDGLAKSAETLTIPESQDVDSWLDFEEESPSRKATPEEIAEYLENNEKTRQIELARLGKIEDFQEKIETWLKFLYSIAELSQSSKVLTDLINQIVKIKSQIKINKFHQNTTFCKAVNDVMNHNKEEFEYLYHGTTCIEDADSILKSGLFLAREDIYSTSFSEFTPEQLILYERGFAGEIGSSAVVIIARPINQNIIKTINQNDSIEICPSGLQGLDIKMNHLIPSKFIVGYVDKQNNRVVLNDSFMFEKNSEPEK